MEEKKPFWQNFDFISKIFIGIIAALLPFLVSWQAQVYNQKKQQVETVKSFLEDLSVKDNQVKQDIALLILNNYSQGTRDTTMVKNIAVSIITTRMSKDSFLNASNIATLNSALLVIQKDTSLLNPIIAELNKKRESLRSHADTAIAVGNKQGKTDYDFSFIQKISPRITYIQYNSDELLQPALLLQKKCNARKWNAPGIEQIKKDFSSSVRYFHPEDFGFAQNLASLVKDSLKIVSDIKILNLSASSSKVPKGQVEVWLGKK